MTNTQEILKQFGIEVDADAIRPLGSGLINDTFRVTTPCNDTPDYVLQRINHAIFTDVRRARSHFQCFPSQRHPGGYLSSAHQLEKHRLIYDRPEATIIFQATKNSVYL